MIFRAQSYEFWDSRMVLVIFVIFHHDAIENFEDVPTRIFAAICLLVLVKGERA